MATRAITCATEQLPGARGTHPPDGLRTHPDYVGRDASGRVGRSTARGKENMNEYYDKMSNEARVFSRAIKLPQEELAAVDSKLIVQTGGSL